MPKAKESEGLKISPAKVYGIRTQTGGGAIVSFEVDASQADEVAALFLMHQDEIPAELTVKKYVEKTVNKRN